MGDDEKGEHFKIEELRDRVSGCDIADDDNGFLTDATLRRYLVAREWDLDAAEHQLRETLLWRLEYKPQTVQCKVCKETPGSHAMRQIGFDRKGRPVLYLSFIQSSVDSVDVEESVHHITFLMENAARSLKDGATDFVWVVDFTGMKVATCNPRLGLAVERILTKHYPECLGALVCLNHGLMFQTFWRGVKNFMDQKTVSKVYIHRSQEKIVEEFTELFHDDLKQWLLEEIRMNKIHPLSDSQKQFWKHDPDNTHDPRGCPSYVAECIKGIPVEDFKDGTLNVYHPHPNILQEILRVSLSDN